ncbi:MAG: glucose 1-dehydrogenase [Candidatus Binataceae bacterium]|jgi:NAD(P)-dependent dehydrogenase (short-subunit alcohol dehydrogenase family)
MANLLEGKIALITGCGSGIGLATAINFAREGAIITGADVNREGGEATIKTIRDAGGKADFVLAEVTDPTQVQALIAGIVKAHGRLDCAYNNAGIEGDVASIHDVSERNFDRVMAINVKGVWLCLKYEFQQMLKQGGGAIVNTASVAGLSGFASMSIYVASKHAVVGITKSAAIEGAPRGIRVNAVCPGPVDTPMMERIANNEGAPARKDFEAIVPMRRYARPEEIAITVTWLCSEQSSYVTGVCMPVDGGLFAS